MSRVRTRHTWQGAAGSGSPVRTSHRDERGNFATSLLQAGVVDEIGLNIHPVLLGSGVPAFLDPGARVKLELTECRQLDGGCVLVTYKVRTGAYSA